MLAVSFYEDESFRAQHKTCDINDVSGDYFVNYKTATQQAVTGLDGSFQCEAGESVRVLVGDTLLGQVKGKQQVTPPDPRPI